MKCVMYVAALALSFGVSSSFAAQTCGTPTALTSGGVTGVNGCNETNTVGTLCLFNNNPSPDVVFSFHLASGYTATQISLTNHTGGFTPQMVLQSSCGSSSDCTVTANAAAAGGNTSLSLAGPLPVGDYFLVVDGSSTTSATDCGTFDLGVDGTLPVKLQKFSVD